MHKEDMSSLTKTQLLGYLAIRFLGGLQSIIYKYVVKDLVWRSADGRCTPLRKMENGHLLNTINMLFRTGSYISQYKMYKALIEEKQRRERCQNII